MPLQRFGRVADHRRLGRLVHVRLALRVGVTMADHLVAALPDARGDLRHALADRGVEQVTHRQAQLFHHVEYAVFLSVNSF